jgi:HTH-type transcriptional regulator / antitoxin HigA
MITAFADPVQMIEQGAPHLIHSEAELASYTAKLLMLTAKDSPTEAELEAIDLLSLLIEQYEIKRYPIPAATPSGVLRYLLDSNGLKQKDLIPELGKESNVSLILAGKRNLTITHIHALAARFNVPASVFLASPPYPEA